MVLGGVVLAVAVVVVVLLVESVGAAVGVVPWGVGVVEPGAPTPPAPSPPLSLYMVKKQVQITTTDMSKNNCTKLSLLALLRYGRHFRSALLGLGVYRPKPKSFIVLCPPYLKT